MKPFNFRLQTALDIKLRQEELAREALQRAISSYENSVEVLNSFYKQMEWVQEQVRRSQKKTVNLEDVKRCQDFIPVLIQKIEIQKAEVEERRSEVDRVRTQLIAVMRERKVMEKIKARYYHRYIREVLLEEQKLIDEMATNRFILKDNPI
ncbi:flagellar export protein FliJ [Thermincola ferriacetica]|uniref:Flagellar FliJ protein n=1 Tax=Thermincola ferriacetica TaxID=281456 RepID=A0A0L6W709_9FIRM|nr:flagellar export protein FliJ [Thermincola ferriacetica]KNZ70884.1 flagellar export protein FliJ [Thermincola ferriacetica]